MSNSEKPLLIKRYASRRLYNTETSDYVTLEDIAGFIRDGREVQIVDLKSGDDLTRQYLLQIIAEHESRGESVLPINVLNDLVRSYTTQATSMVPQFLAQSFEMFRDSQSKWVENMNAMNPMAKMPGFEAMQAQQEAFMKAMTQGGPGGTGPRAPGAEEAPGQGGGTAKAKPAPRRGAEPPTESAEDIEALKKEFAELQAKLAKFGK
ncbi:polyhydroxyalkanoate synthesis repressor PhaR [Roseivivax sp. GX 12232]|uniref:polyhydroxyalkanoate synthesis repressor PhaR n=1 Tax=Roseivivax sp. GX 12232 TaxID=2900547 RepID=UPI001E56CF84|nr:polyhydroxyalkanoate synthesis repressor PhaR [Roseivivax sp. GX 12232]